MSRINDMSTLMKSGFSFTIMSRNYETDPEADRKFLSFNDLVVGQDKPVVESQRPEELPFVVMHGMVDTGRRIDLLSDWTGDREALLKTLVEAQRRPSRGIERLAWRRSEQLLLEDLALEAAAPSRVYSEIESAIGRGERAPYVMFSEILPNVLSVVVVEFTVRVGYAIFAIATLGFLGYGVGGAIAWGIGVSLLMLGGLRALQTETGTMFTGNLSWLPYIIVMLVGVMLISLAVLRVYNRKGPGA